MTWEERFGPFVKTSWIHAVAAIQQLPYGRASDVLADRRGTCSSKHYLLAEELKRWGITVRFVHTVYEVRPGLSDVHTTLQIEVPEHLPQPGPHRVDATFPTDRPWDGTGDMPVACAPGVEHDGGEEPAVMKAALVAEHCDPVVREPFIASLAPSPAPSHPRSAEFVDAVMEGLLARRLEEDAAPMAAYLKTERPFLGVKSPARKELIRELKKEFKPETPRARIAWCNALWARPEREARYVAIDFAGTAKRHIVPENLEVYESWIREGAWWDLVDPIATKLVGGVWRGWRTSTAETMDRWIEDPHFWVRRAALIGQLKHRTEADEKRLFRYASARMHEKEFFIRKAIGWALREHARWRPEAVRAFCATHRADLSGLSYREAMKHLA